jgi:peptidoglycan-N-acetylglucosamine deacetylase
MNLRVLPQYGSRGIHKLVESATQSVMGTITHVITQEPLAALTFDDGPHPEFTPRLLDVLERYQAHATFFMLGEAAHRHPGLVKRVAQAGHAIGNHSWDHPSFPLITGHERREQIRTCERALSPYGLRLFRPPFGQQSISSRLDALRLGYEVVTWNLDVGDWWDYDAYRIANLLTSRIRSGSVVVLHDALRRHPKAERRPVITREPYFDRGPMLSGITMFLERVADRFRFITIPELLRYGRPQRKSWFKTLPAASESG